MAPARCLVHLDTTRKRFEIRPKLDANSKRIKYSPKNEKRCSRGLLCVRGSSEQKQIDYKQWYVFEQNSFFFLSETNSVFYVSDINTDTQYASAGSSPPLRRARGTPSGLLRCDTLSHLRAHPAPPRTNFMSDCGVRLI